MRSHRSWNPVHVVSSRHGGTGEDFVLRGLLGSAFYSASHYLLKGLGWKEGSLSNVAIHLKGKFLPNYFEYETNLLTLQIILMIYCSVHLSLGLLLHLESMVAPCCHGIPSQTTKITSSMTGS